MSIHTKATIHIALVNLAGLGANRVSNSISHVIAQIVAALIQNIGLVIGVKLESNTDVIHQ